MPEKAEYTIEKIAAIVKGELVSASNRDAVIKQLLIDSRKLVTPENSVFFALTTKLNNGHKYIDELYEKGVRNFIVSEELDNSSNYSFANIVRVKNTLSALQMLAAYHRKKFDIPVIGITGSNGKTIVKEWLFQLMFEDRKIVRSPKSFNSQIGVPLSVWQIEADHDLAVFEAGISEIDEMDRLQAIIQPTIGIFTNIGQAHGENFIHQEQKIAEKLKLFTKVQDLIYCSDYLEIKGLILKSENLKNIKTFTWSYKTAASLQIKKVSQQKQHAVIEAVYNNLSQRIIIPFTDEASVENAIHCWCTMIILGYEQETIAQRMAALAPVAMRLEMKEGINNCSIINDSYNSDFNSLSIAIDFLNQQKQHIGKTVILSDILQSGRDEDELYKEVAALLKDKKINRIIGIGKAIGRQKDKFRIDKFFYDTTEDFIRDFSFSEFHDETILLKGARKFKFERISKIMQQKAHETVLEINLNSLVHNLNYYRGLLYPETRIMAMVKAFSYGSGSYEIANVLQYHQVDYLSVAYTDEGIELRKAGITSPIMVMNPEEQSFDAMLRYNLEPEIYSFRILSLFEDALKRNFTDQDKKGCIHIKMDTGMHRLGFEENDLNELISRIKENPGIIIRSIFSHLAASDDPAQDEFTHAQIDKFTEMSTKIMSVIDYPVMRHILNSAGISRFRESQFEMVRLGIGLYGVGCNDTEQQLLQNVSTLRSIISQIKQIKKGESIGYGRHWVAPKDMRTATIPIGYADGLSRKLGNGRGKLFIDGKAAPIIGNVCMDMCMVDITDIGAAEGDDVIIFGTENPVSNFAADMDTIPYEVLTSVSRRVKRIYYQE